MSDNKCAYCPFCGSEYIYCQWNYMADGFKYREIHCNKCGATLTKYSQYIEDDYELYELWNTRHERTCENVSKWKDERLECSECGCITDYVSYEDEPYMMTDEGATIPSFCPNCGAPKRGAVCEYCGTHFGRYQGQASIEIEPDIMTIYSWDGSTAYQFVNDYHVNVKVVSE